jgi:hypothetical protein
MKRLFVVLPLLLLCNPSHAQDRRLRGALERLIRRIAELEERVAALERRSAGSDDVHGYYAGDRELPKAERVPGAHWLRKVSGLTYAKPQVLGYSTPSGGSTVWALSAVRRGRPTDQLVEDFGFRPFDRILSVNGVLTVSLPERRDLSKALESARGIGILVERRQEELQRGGDLVVLSFRIAPPVHPEAAAPEPPLAPEELAKQYRVLMASVSDDPKRSTVTLQHVGTRRTVTLAHGDELGGYRVLSIAVHGEGEAREAEVTLLTRAGHAKIRLARAD